MTRDLSPAHTNSRIAPRPNSLLMFAKSNGRFLSAKATLISGLQANASPRAAWAASDSGISTQVTDVHRVVRVVRATQLMGQSLVASVGRTSCGTALVLQVVSVEAEAPEPLLVLQHGQIPAVDTASAFAVAIAHAIPVAAAAQSRAGTHRSGLPSRPGTSRTSPTIGVDLSSESSRRRGSLLLCCPYRVPPYLSLIKSTAQ